MEISDDRIDAQLKLFHGAYPAEAPLLWQTSNKRPPARPDYVAEPYDSSWWTTPTDITYAMSPSNKQAFVNHGGGDAGTMTLERSSGHTTIVSRSNRLAEYQR